MKQQAMRMVVLLSATVLITSDAAAQIPETPAGRQFSAWLAAFNSGDRARIRQYLETNHPTANVDAQVNFREVTGGFEFRKLEEATPTTLIGLVQERNSDQFARFNFAVEATEPHKVTRLALNVWPVFSTTYRLGFSGFG